VLRPFHICLENEYKFIFAQLHHLFQQTQDSHYVHDMGSLQNGHSYTEVGFLPQPSDGIGFLAFRRNIHVKSGDILVTECKGKMIAQRIFNVIKTGPDLYEADAVAVAEPVTGYGLRGTESADYHSGRLLSKQIPDGPC
jgi:hypothetical protein